MTDLRVPPDDPRDDRELWDAVGGRPGAAARAGLPAASGDQAQSGGAGRRRGSPVQPLPLGPPHHVATPCAGSSPRRPSPRPPPSSRSSSCPRSAAPDTATASDMLASMTSPAVSAKTVRLTIKEGVTNESSPASPVPDSELATETLILSTAGDYRHTTVGHHKANAEAELPAMTTTDTWTYDERRHQMMGLGLVDPDDGGSVLAIERPSWGSDIWESWPYVSFQGLASTLRARLAEEDPDSPVTETTYLGRPAWHANFVEHLPGDDGKEYVTHWSVTVDKATGLLMRSDFGDGPTADQALMSFWVAAIELDPELPDGWQRISESGLPRISVMDAGTRFGTPAEVAKRTWPTLVLVPQRVPDGYRLTDVASTDFQGMKSSPKMKNRLVYESYRDPHKTHWIRTSIDGSVQRVMLRYRRGFSMFTIDIRPNGSKHPIPGPRPQDATDVTLSAGYLAGRTASTSIAPNFGKGPTLIAKSDRSTITISGDLTRREMIALANSLKAYGDVDKPLPKGYGKQHRAGSAAKPQGAQATPEPIAQTAGSPLKPVWSGMYSTAANDGFTAVATGPDGAVYAAGYASSEVAGRRQRAAPREVRGPRRDDERGVARAGRQRAGEREAGGSGLVRQRDRGRYPRADRALRQGKRHRRDQGLAGRQGPLAQDLRRALASHGLRHRPRTRRERQRPRRGRVDGQGYGTRLHHAEATGGRHACLDPHLCRTGAVR